MKVPDMDVKFELKNLFKCDLAPGDKLVLHLDYVCNDNDVKNIRDLLGQIFPGHQVIVLERGAKLSVIRSSEPDLRTFMD